MRQRSLFLAPYCLVVAFLVLQPSSPAGAGDDAKEIKVAGILIDKTGDSLSVKPDGEDEVVKYNIPKNDKKVTDALKNVFNACRVKLTYKKVGDDKQVTSASRQILKEKGTVTGTVVKLYNNFWVEVKPKEGLNDAFAPGANYNNKEFMDMLRALKPGDSVTIKYYTDFERHRIETLKKNENADKK